METITFHWEFRVWICVEKMHAIPLTLLQCGVKRIQESGNSLRECLIYANQLSAGQPFEKALTNRNSAFEGKSQPIPQHVESNLILKLCYLHATLAGRNQYGSVGWKAPYTVTLQDIHISTFLLAASAGDIRFFLDLIQSQVYESRVRCIYDQLLIEALGKEFWNGKQDIEIESLKEQWKDEPQVKYLVLNRSSPKSPEIEGKGNLIGDSNLPSTQVIQNTPLNDDPKWFGISGAYSVVADGQEITEFLVSLKYALSLPREAFTVPSKGTKRKSQSNLADFAKILSESSLNVALIRSKFFNTSDNEMNGILQAEAFEYCKIRTQILCDITEVVQVY